MQFKEVKLFYTPETQEELEQRILEIANGSKDALAVWTAVMMLQNFVAREQQRELTAE